MVLARNHIVNSPFVQASNGVWANITHVCNGPRSWLHVKVGPEISNRVVQSVSFASGATVHTAGEYVIVSAAVTAELLPLMRGASRLTVTTTLAETTAALRLSFP